MEKKNFTVSIYTENNLGLLSRIAAIFLKRHINIESITASPSEVPEVMRFIIVVEVTEEQIKKIVGQIEKQIEVIKAFYHTAEEMIYQETALYKIKSSEFLDDLNVQAFIKATNARIVTVTPKFFVIEKTGKRSEVDELYETLKPYGLMQFVRSGTIAVTKNEMPITGILEKFNTTNSIS
ncbi:MAG: acetolactate synthase small subunit [Zunongwangia sp.]|uniref:Acetolactate synthase small subunit n=3 Tax=Zunongwangia profunda TaxID=398743 RepID=D5BG08_ZUNPS|nr:acetolactate synthase small subunit [Zunongwangia profunda]MAO35224.1 acetolactate synthase small subunit [Zunongwangia sp.]ADF53121.1 acetolactate synthase small subunit [Zunongwangia profunda SM-A87]MCC4227791.1 acetolactate synthase small subunit [Zunongwangia profunda]HAJ82297.1 acetolactate synthase small subunit [Zunongwangia profunda]HCV81528.1 acetolactate synthase small subunit [Zunongwangia profunda]|tara:strand:+ start:6643 stop:7182 length:540 start_codon:yes stop_codon:yes gene_type:complete